MAGWTLLKDQTEWNLYRESLAAQHHLTDVVAWGRGPQHYPCLVTTLVQELKVTSCYLYPAEAAQLVAAAGSQVAAVAPPPVGPTLSDFAKSVSAHLLALFDAMESVNITNRNRHAETYARHLAMVDQYQAEDRAALAAKLSPGQQFILDEIFPKRHPDDNCPGR